MMINIPTARFTEWQRSLASQNRRREEESIAEMIRERQSVLVGAMSQGPNALATYLRSVLHIPNTGLEELPPLPRELSAPEASEPPPELESELYNAWATLTPKEASQPAFWTICHIRWREEGTLGNDPIETFTDRRVTDTDAQTRDLLRHLGGIYVRGNVSVFSDCPLARAWWRRRFAVSAAEPYTRSSQC